MSLITRFRSQAAEPTTPQAEPPDPGPIAADAADPDPAAADPAAADPAAADPADPGPPAADPAGVEPGGTKPAPASTRRRYAATALTVAAALLVFAALVVPDSLGRLKPGQFVPGAFLRIPLEGLLGAALLLALPLRARRLAAPLLGLGLGVLTVLKITNMGFLNVLARRFDPVLDWRLFGDGYNYLVETSGRATAVGALAGVIVLAVAVPALVTLAVVRLLRLVARHRRPATRTVTASVAAWTVFALVGTQLFPGAPVASDSAVTHAKNTARMVPRALQDQRTFLAEARVDAFRDIPAEQLLTGLRGKDVVFGVVESYGRAALENPRMAAVVDPALAEGTRQLTAAGYSARSGFLTSSTYGGGSWLAHASFQSGLWINNQQRYRQLTSGDRLTLTKAFQRAGWWTVGVEPGNTRAWPEAAFYGYDDVYDSRNLGYRGPRFGWSRMPDQFTLAAFQRNVYAKRAGIPLMAEITLTSSHQPWAPLPETVDWADVGDGTVYGPIAERAVPKAEVWKKKSLIRTAFAKSVAYSVGSLISWAETYGDDNLVLVIFGDHQPTANVSGEGADHDVPISIIARDPAVLDRISGWGWQDGLRPDPQAPVWRMDAFRDRFLTAFGAPVTTP